MPDYKLSASIEAKDSATPVIAQVRDAYDQLADSARAAGQAAAESGDGASEAEGFFSRLGSELASRFVITLGDVTALLGKVKDALGAVVTSASSEEDALNRLGIASRFAGDASKDLVTALSAQAEGLEATTRFSKDAILQGQALFLQLTQNASAAQASTTAAVNLASVLGTDVQNAFLLLAKAAEGHTEALARYGIAVDTNIPKTQQYTELLKILNGQMGDAATADVNTFSGALTLLGHAVEESTRQVGDGVVKNQELVQSIKDLTSIVELSRGSFSTIGSVIRSGLTFAVQEANGVLGLVANIFSSAGTAASSMAANTDRAKVAMDGAAAAARAFNAALTPAEQILEGSDKAARDFVSSVHDLGITLEGEANSALKDHATLLEEADAAYRQGIITRTDYLAIQRAIAQAEAETNAKLQEQVGVATDAAGGIDAYGAALERVTALANSAAAAARAVTAAAQGFASINFQGWAPGSQFETGRFTATVPAGWSVTQFLDAWGNRAAGGGGGDILDAATANTLRNRVSQAEMVAKYWAQRYGGTASGFIGLG